MVGGGSWQMTHASRGWSRCVSQKVAKLSADCKYSAALRGVCNVSINLVNGTEL